MANDLVPKSNEVVVLDRDRKPKEDGPSAEFQAVLELTREQLRIADRRNDVALAAIKASDESDQRQFLYHSQSLRDDAADRTARLKFGKAMLVGAFTAATVVGAFLFWMMFFGIAEQSSNAKWILTILLYFVGGGGIFKVLQTIFQKFFRP